MKKLSASVQVAAVKVCPSASAGSRRQGYRYRYMPLTPPYADGSFCFRDGIPNELMLTWKRTVTNGKLFRMSL